MQVSGPVDNAAGRAERDLQHAETLATLRHQACVIVQVPAGIRRHRGVPAPAAPSMSRERFSEVRHPRGDQEQRAAHEELAPQRKTERHHRIAQVHHTALSEFDTELLLRRLLEPTAGIEEDGLRRPHRQLA
jgi:hypothetical protein